MAIPGLSAARVAKRLLTADELDAIRRIPIADAGHGHDRFGMSRAGIAFAIGVLRPLYKHWFRVSSYGIERVPAEGGAIVAANHSGMLPLDAMMLCCDIALRGEPPRALRVVMDHFVDLLPAVGPFFTHGGGVSGARGNFHNLLSAGELVGVFPEGDVGISKPFSQRYQLTDWRVGHAELAIRHQVPIVPVAIIGAEEQWPQLGKLPIQVFGAPFIPVPVTPIPLPVHYHIHYGEPIPIPELFDAADWMRAEPVHRAAGMVRDAVEELIADGLSQREGVFR